jgi:hypothetical protein
MTEERYVQYHTYDYLNVILQIMSMVELCSVISVVAENSLNCCSMNIVNEDTTLSMTITQNVSHCITYWYMVN